MAGRHANMQRRQKAQRPTCPELEPRNPPVEERKSNEEEMGRKFRDWLLDKYKYKGMTADELCTISYLSTGAGAVGVEDLCLDPQAKGDNAARTITRALGMREDRLYWKPIPMWDSKEQRRILCSFPIRPVHEAFSAAYHRSPEDFKVSELPEGQNLASVYYAHPVTVQVGDKSFPVGFFSDALPHTKRDSVYCWYWSNIITGKRHLICVLREKDLCQCSCPGQCTFIAIQRLLVWTFNILAEGKWSETRDDGTAFTDWRASMNGDLAEGLRGALCQARADLLEYVTALGFKNWSNKLRPCFCCTATKEEMFDFPEYYADNVWSPIDAETYNRTVKSCLKRIRVNEKQLNLLKEKLQFDHRKTGYVGLALLDDLPEVGLTAGHRLVEEGPVHDLHEFASVEAPALLTFFNCEGDHGLNFICQLFAIIGFTTEILALDVMHILDLGVLQWLLGKIFHTLITKNFAKSIHATSAGRQHDNVVRLRVEFGDYYKSFPPGERKRMSRMHNVSMKMLGKKKFPRLHAKAAETRHLLKLGQQLCYKHMPLLGATGVDLASCTDHLINFYEVMRREPMQMSPLGVRLLQTHMSSFLQAWKAAGGRMVYKHHMAWHMAQQAGVTGNPRCSHTYPDEAENRHMGVVAKGLHGGMSFYKTFLLKVCPDL